MNKTFLMLCIWLFGLINVIADEITIKNTTYNQSLAGKGASTLKLKVLDINDLRKEKTNHKLNNVILKPKDEFKINTTDLSSIGENLLLLVNYENTSEKLFLLFQHLNFGECFDVSKYRTEVRCNPDYIPNFKLNYSYSKGIKIKEVQLCYTSSFDR